MDMVTCIKMICKERRIPISKLEKDCGFSNGYIRSLKKGILPADRLAKIADYLGVGYDYFNLEPPMTTERARDMAQINQLTADFLKLNMDERRMVLRMVASLGEKHD